jgi:hypothetical protein
MHKLGTGGLIAVGALALLFTAAPAKLETGGLVVKSAEARVFKGGSSQRVGSVNPADPGPVTVPVPNTRGGGKGGGGKGGGKNR